MHEKNWNHKPNGFGSALGSSPTATTTVPSLSFDHLSTQQTPTQEHGISQLIWIILMYVFLLDSIGERVCEGVGVGGLGKIVSLVVVNATSVVLLPYTFFITPKN